MNILKRVRKLTDSSDEGEKDEDSCQDEMYEEVEEVVEEEDEDDQSGVEEESQVCEKFD